MELRVGGADPELPRGRHANICTYFWKRHEIEENVVLQVQASVSERLWKITRY